MSKRTKPRLGKGLSGLISQPVPIEAGPAKGSPDQVKTPSTSAEGAGRAREMPRPERPLEVASQISSPSQQVISESVSLADGRRMRAIEVASVEPNRYQPRRVFDTDALEALADSIRRSGVMQPIAVRTAQGDSDKAWEIVAGERRWRAAKRAGLKKIPAIVVDLSERESAEWALVENLQREDLNPIERADALKALADEFGLTHQQISDQVGLDRATVSNLIRMTDLEAEIRLLITAREGERLTGGHGRALLAVADSAERVELAKRSAREGWSVRALEREIALSKENNATPPAVAMKKERGGEDAAHPSIVALERELSEYLNTKVRIESDKARTKGRLVISFYDVDHFESLRERMNLPKAGF